MGYLKNIAIDKIKGAIVTNQRICIVDSQLSIIRMVSLTNNVLVNSVMWFGNTVLYGTERQLRYVTENKNEGDGILFGFNCC